MHLGFSLTIFFLNSAPRGMVSTNSMKYCHVIILMLFVPEPPGVESGGHSYCCDFCKSLLKTTTMLQSSKKLLIKHYPWFATSNCLCYIQSYENMLHPGPTLRDEVGLELGIKKSEALLFLSFLPENYSFINNLMYKRPYKRHCV